MTAIYQYHGPGQATPGLIIDHQTSLWLVRMCVGEGGRSCTRQKASAMMWSLTNRWFLHPGRRHWPTFLDLVRGFSQPINPRWQAGGSLARRHAGTKHATPARLARRAGICALGWRDIPRRIVQAVDDFQSGLLFPPDALASLDRPRISNWASHKHMAVRYPWGLALDSKKQPDWFFEDSHLRTGCVIVSPGSKAHDRSWPDLIKL